ncbi:MAG: hypothetical protein ACXWCP_16560 [Burkholderiales bacterium]
MIGYHWRMDIMSAARPGGDSLNDRRFKQMRVSEKLAFIGKALVFFISGGFIFPTLWVD